MKKPDKVKRIMGLLSQCPINNSMTTNPGIGKELYSSQICYLSIIIGAVATVSDVLDAIHQFSCHRIATPYALFVKSGPLNHCTILYRSGILWKSMPYFQWYKLYLSHNSAIQCHMNEKHNMV